MTRVEWKSVVGAARQVTSSQVRMDTARRPSFSVRTSTPSCAPRMAQMASNLFLLILMSLINTTYQFGRRLSTVNMVEGTCPNACSNRGHCRSGVCVCEPGFTHFDCSLRTCAADCSGAGSCFDGVCRCDEGLCGTDCSLRCCPNDCSGRGECDHVGDEPICRCQPGFGGDDCSLRVCPNNCSGRGECRAPVGTSLAARATWAPVCECNAGFTGFDCSLNACLDDCSGVRHRLKKKYTAVLPGKQSCQAKTLAPLLTSASSAVPCSCGSAATATTAHATAFPALRGRRAG